MEPLHRPVMTREVFDIINLLPGKNYADLTFGEGGHSRFFLQKPIGALYATDRDLSAVTEAKCKPEWSGDNRFHLFHSKFSEFPNLIGDTKFEGILVDLGVSTRQLLEGERGFSFFSDGPLDMRMDPSSGPTLEELLSTYDVDSLAMAIRNYTDMPHSRAIARKILDRFEKQELKTTKDLATLMGSPRPGKAHPATALFLALRMLVNEELEQIDATIPHLIPLLNQGGRLAVLTFHSTEDRRIKRIFRLLAGQCICEKDICTCPRNELVKILTPKPLVPSDEELRENPRARSTKLRAVEKL